MPGFSYFPRFVYYQWFVTPPVPTTSFAKQTVIITGSNTGLGLEAAKHVTRLGAERVILAVRTITKGETAKQEIEQETGRNGVVQVWQLDLQSYDSVKAFATRASQELDRIDVLLENAGISLTKYSLAESQEATMTVNVISTLLLALLLLPKLRATAHQFKTEPRLTVVSSEVHYFGVIPKTKNTSDSTFEVLAKEESFAVGQTYWNSKLILVLAMQQMIKELASDSDESVIINHVNPGLCASSLMKDFGLAATVTNTLFHARSIEVGSRTLVHGASTGRETHGKYLSNCDVTPTSSYVISAVGQSAGERIWQELKGILEGVQPGVIQAAQRGAS